MISEENRRDHHRMAIVSPAKYWLQSDTSDTASISCMVKNLSATGMLLITNERKEVGDLLLVHINPDNPITPPLRADLEVLRCDAGENGDLEVACKILKMH